MRDYYSFGDDRTAQLLHLTSFLKTSFPGHPGCFDSIACDTSLRLLEKWPGPDAFLHARKDTVMRVLGVSRRGKEWCSCKYDALRKAARDAMEFGVQYASDGVRIQCAVQTIRHLDHIQQSSVNACRPS